MADRDHTTHTTTTGSRPTDYRDPDYRDPDYRDPRTTTTTTTRSGGTSWIGIIIAVLAIAVIAAWWAGGFDRGDETAMMVGEPAVEGEVLDQGAVPDNEVIEQETTTVPLDNQPAATEQPAETQTTPPAQQ
jgi:hypothetical protein